MYHEIEKCLSFCFFSNLSSLSNLAFVTLCFKERFNAIAARMRKTPCATTAFRRSFEAARPVSGPRTTQQGDRQPGDQGGRRKDRLPGQEEGLAIDDEELKDWADIAAIINNTIIFR